MERLTNRQLLNLRQALKAMLHAFKEIGGNSQPN
jgi:hypothetical protein